jgi:hypothetical protein
MRIPEHVNDCVNWAEKGRRFVLGTAAKDATGNAGKKIS